MLKLTNENFNNVIVTNTLVIVDFWATWCGPCVKMSPTIDALSQKYPGILVAKAEVDLNNDACTAYNIRGIPALVYFKDGVVVNTSVGMVSLEKIAQHIQTYFGDV